MSLIWSETKKEIATGKFAELEPIKWQSSLVLSFSHPTATRFQSG